MMISIFKQRWFAPLLQMQVRMQNSDAIFSVIVEGHTLRSLCKSAVILEQSLLSVWVVVAKIGK